MLKFSFSSPIARFCITFITFITLGASVVPIVGCKDSSQLNQTLTKVEEALKGNPQSRKEKLFGADGGREGGGEGHISGNTSEEAHKNAQFNYDDSKLTAQQKEIITKLLNSNTEDQILKDGSFCNEILFLDTSQKLIETLSKNGYGQKLSFKVGVTAMPEGTQGKMIWRELWRVTTQKGTLNYPMIFIEDGEGGAFFVGLKPYYDHLENPRSSTTSSKTTDKKDNTPNFFNALKPMLSKNQSNNRIKYTILYFSASWCGPCLQFTPKLAQWYNTIKKEHPEMEIVFVSSDRSKTDFEEYGKKMPWAHLAFEHKDNPQIREYAAGGIPFLVLINENGTALTEKKHPSEILPVIEEFITGESGQSKQSLKTGIFN